MLNTCAKVIGTWMYLGIFISRHNGYFFNIKRLHIVPSSRKWRPPAIADPVNA